jgi:hypothetical protein
MSWQALQLNAPQGLLDAGQTIAQGIDAVKSALEAIEAEIRIAQTFANTQESPAVEATNTAIRASVAAVTALVEALLDSAGIYVLLVPLPKKGLVRMLMGSDAVPGGNPTNAPIADMLRHLPAAIANNLRNSPSFTQLFNGTNLFTGGNAYFVKTVAESFSDPGDINRPQFDRNSYWAYAMLLGGASDITSALSVASFIDRLLSPVQHANQTRADHSITNVVPRSVVIRPSARGYQPVISWEPIPASAVLANFDNAQVVPTEFAVIRSTDFRAKTATKVSELFSSNVLTAGMMGQFGAQVIAVRPFDGLLNQYVDTDELDADKTYFYHVAFKTELRTNPFNTSARYPYELLSTAVEFRRPRNARQLTSTTMSRPPDWMRTPSVPALWPALDRYMDLVLEALNSLKTMSQSATDRNDAYLAMLNGQIASLNSRVSEIELYLNQMRAIFSSPEAGLYATMRTGQGGIFSLLSDMITTLDDTSDSNRPPFDNGDEYVTGAVILAVGPDPAPVQAAFALFSAIFGPADESEALVGINAVQQNAVQAVTDAAEAISSQAFGPDMQALPAGSRDDACPE